MSSLKVSICGLDGRMGQAITELMDDLDGLELVGSFEKSKEEKLAADVLIDFSSPEGFVASLGWCVDNNVPFVSGTTGLSENDFSKLNKASKSIPVLWAPNMSLGIHFMTHLLKNLSAIAEDFEFQLEELHHKKKVDAPSGTAIFLQNHLQEAVHNKAEEPIAVRGGGIFGIHKVWAMGEEETLTIEHTALNRKVFARGALRAAEWLSGKKPGRYEMNDLLGL